MNYSRTSHLALSLRFRRWSRKAWAVFASVGREVTIGTLRDGIAEQSMAKAHVPAGACAHEAIQQLQEEQDELEEVQLRVVEVLPLTLAVPAGAASAFFFSTIFNGWYGFGRIDRFFIPIMTNN